jgi:transcriptional regulator with XRE-family HTH domain
MARPAKDKGSQAKADAFAQTLSRLRKERGFTQAELANKIGSIQVVLSDYERGKVRPNADMLVRLATALEVSTDELLGIAARTKLAGPAHNRRFLRRLHAIDKLPKRDQDALLRTIDAFLQARKAS